MEIFNNISISDFNKIYGTELTAEMDLSDAFEEIEEKVSNWYFSLDKEEVIDDINDNSETLSRMTVNLLFIEDLKIYIATTQQKQ